MTLVADGVGLANCDMLQGLTLDSIISNGSCLSFHRYNIDRVSSLVESVTVTEVGLEQFQVKHVLNPYFQMCAMSKLAIIGRRKDTEAELVLHVGQFEILLAREELQASVQTKQANFQLSHENAAIVEELSRIALPG